jgi:hypothetical protein
MKFKVCDRVEIIEDIWPCEKGDRGTIVNFNGDFVGINFDEYHPGMHTCTGNCEDGYGYYLFEHRLNLIESNPVEPAPAPVIPDGFETAIKSFLEDNLHPKALVLTFTDKLQIVCVNYIYPWAIKDTSGNLSFYKDKPNKPCVINTKTFEVYARMDGE